MISNTLSMLTHAENVWLMYSRAFVLLSHLANKRKEKVFLGLPDALDLMVVCVEAGLGLDVLGQNA